MIELQHIQQIAVIHDARIESIKCFKGFSIIIDANWILAFRPHKIRFMYSLFELINAKMPTAIGARVATTASLEPIRVN